MSSQNTTQSIFLSYVCSDKNYAARLRDLLQPLEMVVTDGCDAEAAADEGADGGAGGDPPAVHQLRSILQTCGLAIVLIGPGTLHSRRVDLEIALATAGRPETRGAGLLGIILPEHPDYLMPYYESANIPPRLHDRVRWEYAMIRKWTEDLHLLKSWIAEAHQRRLRYWAEPNYSVSRILKSWQWNDAAATARSALQKLWDEQS